MARAALALALVFVPLASAHPEPSVEAPRAPGTGACEAAQDVDQALDDEVGFVQLRASSSHEHAATRLVTVGSSSAKKSKYAPVAEEACPSDTGGTCAFSGCSASRGSAEEVECNTWKKCVCKPGYCAIEGMCLEWVSGVTGPPSTWLQKSASAVEASASDHSAAAGGSREKKSGYKQVSEEECPTETGGTCVLSGCSSSRREVECNVWKKCVCKPGYCAYDGMCLEWVGGITGPRSAWPQ